MSRENHICDQLTELSRLDIAYLKFSTGRHTEVHPGPYTCQAYNGYGRGDSWTILVEGKRPIGPLQSDYEHFEKYLIPDTGVEPEIRPTDRVTPIEVVTESVTILPTTYYTDDAETTTVSDYTNYLGKFQVSHP